MKNAKNAINGNTAKNEGIFWFSKLMVVPVRTLVALLAFAALLASPIGAVEAEWKTYNVKDGLVDGKIKSIWVEEGALWVATSAGINVYWKSPTPKWEVFTEAQGLPSKDVRCLAGYQDVLYAGTQKGLAVFDRVKKRWFPVDPKEGIPAEPVNVLLVEGATVWVGFETGLLMYDRAKGRSKFFTVEDGLVDNAIRALATEGEYVFIGTVGAALHAYDKDRKKIRVYTPKKQIFTNIVLGVERNRIWAGTNGGGLRVYNRTTGEWKAVTMKEGLSDDFLQSIGVDGQFIWFGTFDGVSRYDTKSGLWASYGVKDGLADGSVTAIAVDGGDIWFGTDAGISVFRKGYPEVKIGFTSTSIISKAQPFDVSVTVKSSAPIAHASAEYSTSSFPDIWSPKGLAMRQVSGQWRLSWDVASIPTDFETVFLRVKVQDVTERINEATGSVQVDTLPLQVKLDRLPEEMGSGVWTVSGTVNKSTVEEVMLEPGHITARVDPFRKRFSALVSLESGTAEIKVVASDVFGRTASDSVPVRISGQADPSMMAHTVSGTSMRLVVNEKLLFDSGSEELKAEAQPVLLKIVDVVLRNPKTVIRIEGHTDNAPLWKGHRFPSNVELSQARAKGVYDFLVSRGVDVGRLSMVGYGESRPVTPNDSDEARAQNRRVEIVIQVQE